MAGEQTRQITDPYPKIGESYSDNYAGIPDIWPWPYCGDVDEGMEEGFCTEEETIAPIINLRPLHPLSSSFSEWLLVITAYAIVIVPFVGAVIGIFFWASRNLD